MINLRLRHRFKHAVCSTDSSVPDFAVQPQVCLPFFFFLILCKCQEDQSEVQSPPASAESSPWTNGGFESSADTRRSGLWRSQSHVPAVKHDPSCVQPWQCHTWKESKPICRLLVSSVRFLSPAEMKWLLAYECGEKGWKLLSCLVGVAIKGSLFPLYQSLGLSQKKTRYWTQKHCWFSFKSKFCECQFGHFRWFFLWSKLVNILQRHICIHLGFILITGNLWRASVTLCPQHHLSPIWWTVMLA